VSKHAVRWIALGVAAVIVALGMVLAVQHRTEPSTPRLVQQHEPAPDFELTALDDTPVSSRALRGKTYVVNFWNSWCIPCRQEEPTLKAFYDAHRDEPDVAMVGIVRDDEESPVRSYVASNDIEWPIAFDPDGRAALDFGTTGQPETYVISPSGVAACGSLGPVTTAELEAWLRIVRAGGVCG
jgi:cytochrome c biogenesis protein CcmG/thiol:disulfide interchange protein DsbE